MSDLDTLKILEDKDRWKKYYDFIKGNFLTKEGELVGSFIDVYFKEDVLGNVSTLDWQKFAAWFFLKQPIHNVEQRDNYKQLFQRLLSHNVDTQFLEQILKELTVRSYAKDIGSEGMLIADGSSKKTIEDIDTMVQDCKKTLAAFDHSLDRNIVSNDPKELFSQTNNQLLQFKLTDLQAALGGIGIGDFVIVGAYTDTGKTTFLIDQAVHMLQQLPEDKVVVYFNNEQRGHRMKYRMITRLLQQDSHSIWIDPVKTMSDYTSKGGDRLVLVDQAYTTKFCENFLDRNKDRVGLVLFDQLWKMRGASRSSNDFMQLAHTFTWGREIAKEYAPTMTVHQADGSSINQKWLEMDHLYGSKSAAQGDADAIIMIGRMVDESEPHNMRHIYVPKNKLEGLDRSKQNIKFSCFVNHDLCQFQDTI